MSSLHAQQEDNNTRYFLDFTDGTHIWVKECGCKLTDYTNNISAHHRRKGKIVNLCGDCKKW